MNTSLFQYIAMFQILPCFKYCQNMTTPATKSSFFPSWPWLINFWYPSSYFFSACQNVPLCMIIFLLSECQAFGKLSGNTVIENYILSLSFTASNGYPVPTRRPNRETSGKSRRVWSISWQLFNNSRVCI
jgi:hypothetical protein